MERQNVFKTFESIESENCETLFCSHKTKISRSLQKTYLEHRPRPPNVLSQVIWFITRSIFGLLVPTNSCQDPLMVELCSRTVSEHLDHRPWLQQCKEHKRGFWETFEASQRSRRHTLKGATTSDCGAWGWWEKQLTCFHTENNFVFVRRCWLFSSQSCC